MSNVIPPMLSSTPPPMDDDNLEEDEDDEFGDFSTGDINYGLEITQPSKILLDSWEKSDSLVKDCHGELDDLKNNTHHSTHLILELHNRNEEVIHPIAAASQVLTQDNISQDSIVFMGTDSGLCSVSPNSVDTSPVPEQDNLSPMTPSVNSREESCDSDETVIKSLTVDPDRTLPSASLGSTFFNGNLQEEGILQNVQESDLNQSDVSVANNFDEALDNIDNSPMEQPIIPIPIGEIDLFPPESDSTEYFQSTVMQSADIERNSIMEEESDSSDATGMQETTSEHLDSYDELSKHLADLILEKDLLNEPRFEIEDINESETETSEVIPVFLEEIVSQQNDTFDNAIFTNENSPPECEFEEFAAFETAEESSFTAEFPSEKVEEEEDFSDFSSSTFPAPTASSSSFFPASKSNEGGWANLSKPQPPASSGDDDFDDDFDNFETASPLPSDSSQMQFSGVVTSLFPSPSPSAPREDAEVPSSEAVAEASPVWGNLRDVDTSNALTYHWASSTSNKLLLTSLGIDARNILFGPKWNVSVPRFAANLGVSPLEPVRASSPPPLVATKPTVQTTAQLQAQAAHQPTTTATTSDAAVPDAQFDWTSSGLVNPLDCVEKNGQRTEAKEHPAFYDGQRLLDSPRLGTEAAKVIDSLPDLSYVRSRTLVFPQPQLVRPQR